MASTMARHCGHPARVIQDLCPRRSPRLGPYGQGHSPAPTLDDIRYRLEQLCERRYLAGFTPAEEATYERLAQVERELLAARRLCRA